MTKRRGERMREVGTFLQILTTLVHGTARPLVLHSSRGGESLFRIICLYPIIYCPQCSYQSVPPSPRNLDDASSVGPVEMVTVPALGPEWKASEMRDMTKSGRREKKMESRDTYWKEFRRGERGLFGKRWLTRKFIVFFMFGLVIVCVNPHGSLSGLD